MARSNIMRLAWVWQTPRADIAGRCRHGKCQRRVIDFCVVRQRDKIGRLVRSRLTSVSAGQPMWSAPGMAEAPVWQTQHTHQGQWFGIPGRWQRSQAQWPYALHKLWITGGGGTVTSSNNSTFAACVSSTTRCVCCVSTRVQAAGTLLRPALHCRVTPPAHRSASGRLTRQCTRHARQWRAPQGDHGQRSQRRA